MLSPAEGACGLDCANLVGCGLAWVGEALAAAQVRRSDRATCVGNRAIQRISAVVAFSHERLASRRIISTIAAASNKQEHQHGQVFHKAPLCVVYNIWTRFAQLGLARNALLLTKVEAY